LLAMLASTDVSELIIEHAGARVHIRRTVTSAEHAPPVAVAPPVQASVSVIEAVGVVAESLVGQTINAPMVGTFYRAASPTEPPFVQEGEEVQPGSVVGIIEAMKMMNEIESDVSGRIVRVLVQNGQPVEYGQPLYVVEPL
jgi:acetyl-CoA carboxylase biotin carboxyl carrier protein